MRYISVLFRTRGTNMLQGRKYETELKFTATVDGKFSHLLHAQHDAETVQKKFQLRVSLFLCRKQ